jgi:tetratricopeptide (TPR) repeat protein
VDEFAADRPGWADRGGLRLLAADERSALTAAVGEAALLAAQAEWQAPGDRAAAGRRATELLAAAGTCYAPADAPAAIADMVSLVNGKPAADRDTGGPVDGFATAARLMAAGRYEDAAARFEGHVRGQPGDYAGQLALGVCYARLGRPVQAAERLAAAAPLAPANDPRPAFHRGTALLAAGRAEAAEAEFTAALAVRPKWHPALHHRGVARLRRHAYRPAVDDLSDALAAGGPKLPLLVVRAAAHELMGNADEAERDRAAVDRTEAVTAVDFTVRGLRLAKTDPDRAGEAYARALELDPRWLPAQQNLAALADQRGRPAEAEAAARKAAEMAPQYAPARIGLAVLLARAGRRDEAHEAARAAVLLGDDPGVLFQAAAVYARTSRTHPGDRATALDHLRRAVRQGFTESLALERDEDLDALRSLPEFAEILRAVKALAP